MILGDILQDRNPWWQDGAVRRAREYPVRRDLQPAVLSQVLRLEDRRATLLLGPRQVGKTVLLRQTADDLLDRGWPPGNLTYFDFSDERLTSLVTAREVVETVPAGLDPAYPRVFLFDEIRSAPQWDRWLKQAVDDRVGRIVATDSAASLLRDGSRESGQGRWDELIIEPLSFRELARLRALTGETEEDVVRRIPNLHEVYLELGGFPEHALSENPALARERLRSDVADRAILRDLAGLNVDLQRVQNLFVYLVQDSGAELNAEARARDLEADPRSVREWVRLLSETSLVRALDRYTRQPSAALRSKSRIYAADPGLVTAFAASSFTDPDIRARAFEAAVFRHLREVTRGFGTRLAYFRQDENLEIDFVLERASARIGIEVTSSARLRPEKLERVRKAGKVLGADRLVLVYGGVVETAAEGVVPVPLSQFLLAPESLLEGADE